jgi:Ca2+-binding RTX toxin-like protein
MTAVPVVSSTTAGTNIALFADEFAYIAPGLVIGSTTNTALATGANCFVQVAGTLAGEEGVFMGGTGSYVTIERTGLVWGGLDVGILSTAPGTIVNAGRIIGAAAGIDLAGGQPGSIIENSGLIQAGPKNIGPSGFENAGVLSFDSGYTLTNTGTIETRLAGSFSIFAKGIGVQTIVNTGHLIGKVFLGGDGDSFNSSLGTVAGQIDLGTGNDKAWGSSAADTILGGDGADTIFGNAGRDTISGGLGQDKIYGGLGADVLTGGGNNDFFIFNTALSTANIDRITDFSRPSLDKIHLDNAVMSALGGAGALAAAKFYAAPHATHGHDASDRVVYDTSTGALYYDKNGSAAGGVTEIAVLTGHPTLFSSDFLIV